MITKDEPRLRGTDVGVLAVGLLLVFFYQIAAVTWASSDSGESPGSNDFFETNYVISHRGDVSEYPENTLVALDFAYDCGVRLIELDVRMTKDLVPIMFHDASLERTTNSSGPVVNKTWDQIKDLEVGSYFSEDFAGEPVPLMFDVFNWLRERDDLFLWVHLRFTEGDESFSALIKDCGVEAQVVIQVDSAEVSRLKHYQDCLGRAAIIKEPFMPFVVAKIATCKANDVNLMTVMDDLASKYLYEVTDSNGIKVMLTRNFSADEDHISSRFADGAWGYIIDSARAAGSIQQKLGSTG